MTGGTNSPPGGEPRIATLEGEYPMTRERRELLEQAAVQIEDSVNDLDDRVSQSNQWEMEAAEGQTDGGAEMELSP